MDTNTKVCKLLKTKISIVLFQNKIYKTRIPLAVVSCPANINVTTSPTISSSFRPFPFSSYSKYNYLKLPKEAEISSLGKTIKLRQHRRLSRGETCIISNPRWVIRQIFWSMMGNQDMPRVLRKVWCHFDDNNNASDRCAGLDKPWQWCDDVP